MTKKTTLTTFILLMFLTLISVRVVFAEGEEIDLTDSVYQSEENAHEETDLDLPDELDISQDEPFEVSRSDGEAYAVLTDEGKLIFFRSYETYTESSDKQIVKDIFDNEYYGLVYVDIESISVGSYQYLPWYVERNSIKEVCVAEGQLIKPKSMNYWFDENFNLKAFNSKGFDTTNITGMNQLFYQCSSLEKADLSYFDTSAVTNMTQMFSGCSSLKELDISNFNTSNVEFAFGMFKDTGIEVLDLSNFDTSKVENLSYFFSGSSSLTSINFGNGFNVERVSDMSNMFSGCTSLLQLDLSDFNSRNVTNMTSMFEDCSSLSYINLENFRTDMVTDLTKMFRNCSSLETLDLSSFNTSNTTQLWFLFDGCTSLSFVDLSSFNTERVETMSCIFRDCTALTSVKLGEGFTKWVDGTNAYLPSLNVLWTNGNLFKTAKELYEEYPYNALEWAGVWSKIVPAKTINVIEKPSVLVAGEEKQLQVALTPDDVTIKKLKWESSDEEILTADDNGLLKALDAGEATITVSSIDGSSLSESFKVRVVLFAGELDAEFSFEDGYVIIRSEDQSWLNQLHQILLYKDSSNYKGYHIEDYMRYAGCIRMPLYDPDLDASFGSFYNIIAFSNGNPFILDVYEEPTVNSPNVISTKMRLDKKLEAKTGTASAVEVSQAGDLILYSDDEAYLNSIIYPDYSLNYKDTRIPDQELYAASFRNYGYIVLKQNGYYYVIKNTIEEPNNIVKHDGCISVSKEVLIDKGVVSDGYQVFFAGCSYYPYWVPDLKINTAIDKKSAPEDLNIKIVNGDVYIYSDDKNYLKNLLLISIDNTDSIEEYSFRRSRGFGDPDYTMFEFDGDKVFISKEWFTIETGGVPIDEGPATISLQAKGYLDYINTELFISDSGLKEVPEFSYELSGKHLVINSEDEEWLEALCIPYPNYYGVVMGASIDKEAVMNGGEAFTSFSFCNTTWSHFDDGVDISKEKIVKEGKSVRIDLNRGSGHSVANIEYLLKLHAYGYKCSDSFNVEVTNGRKLLPEDLNIDFIDDSAVFSTSDQDFIEFFEAIRFEGNGSNTHIGDQSRIVKENGKITIVGVPERYRTGNCILRIWGNDNSYIVPEYKIYKYTIDYRNIDGSSKPGYFYSGINANLLNKIEGLNAAEYERLRVLLGDDKTTSHGATEDINTIISKIVDPMELSDEERELLERWIGESKTLNEVFNVYLNFVIQYGEEVIFDDAQVTETEGDISVWIEVDNLSRGKHYTFYRIHDDLMEEIPILEYDYENKRVLIKSNKFSTFIFTEMDFFTVSFDSLGGTRIEKQEINKGDLIIKPDDPERAGFTFDGWYTSKNTQDESTVWNFNADIVEKDEILYAKWLPKYQAETPYASIDPEELEKDTLISLYCSTPSSFIFYTLDGSDPEVLYDEENNEWIPQGSTIRYEDAIAIEEDTFIKAIACSKGFKDSDVVSFEYTVKQESEYGTIDEKDIDTYEELNRPENFWTSELYDFTFSPSVKSYVYDTEEIRVYYGNKLLSSGTDYTIKYVNNTKVPQSGSTKLPSITITGKGNYNGTLTRNFDIKPLSLSEDNASVVLNRDSFIYNGKTQRPTVSVTYNGTTLKNKSDYTLEYTDPVLENIYHEGSVRVVFKGNYEGEITKTYRIFEKDTLIPMSSLKVSGIKSSLAYTGSEVLQNEEGIKITYGKTLLVRDRDYTVSYQNNIDAGIAYIIFEGTQNLSNDDAFAGTLTKSFKITPVSVSNKNTSVEGLSASYPYTGQVIKPSLVFKYGDKTLVEDQDYTVSYKNNIKAGKATVTLKGINNYKGTINRTFTIGKIDLSRANVSLDASYRYEKGGSKPLPVITYDGKTLVHNTDYTLSYRNNTKLGTATLTIKGKGNYAGTVTKSFVIISKPIDDDSITVRFPDRVYSTKANSWKSVPVLTDSSGKKLSAGTDYNKAITYTYAYDTKVLDGSSKSKPEVLRRQGEEILKSDILPVNTLIKATINTDNLKVNNYTGEVTKTYRIVQADLSKASVTIPVKYYTGRPVTLSKSEITVKVNKQILSSDDYDIISYENNTAKGTAKVTLKGKGNYGGYKTVSFKISQRSLGITIHFDGNGATSGSMKDQIFYKDGKLNKNSFKKVITEEGITRICTFIGWSTRKNAAKPDYKDTYAYNEANAGRTITLYAVWE